MDLLKLPSPCLAKLISSNSNVPSIRRTWRSLKMPVTPSLIECVFTWLIIAFPANCAAWWRSTSDTAMNDNRHYNQAIRIRNNGSGLLVPSLRATFQNSCCYFLHGSAHAIKTTNLHHPSPLHHTSIKTRDSIQKVLIGRKTRFRDSGR